MYHFSNQLRMYVRTYVRTYVTLFVELKKENLRAAQALSVVRTQIHVPVVTCDITERDIILSLSYPLKFCFGR